MGNLVEIVITSGIISVIVSYLIFQKGNQLKYITEERQKWREKLRKIARDLSGADKETTFRLLTELKVRINTYGYKKESEKDFLKDAHIWNLIAEMEDLSEDEFGNASHQLKKYQNRINDYISLLLKADWERSKNEVNGNYKRVWYIGATAFIIVSLTGVLIFPNINEAVTISHNNLIMAMILSDVLIVVLITPLINYICKRYKKSRSSKEYKDVLEEINIRYDKNNV